MPMLKDGTYRFPGEAEAEVHATRAIFRPVLKAALRDWRACHLRGMRGYYRNAARRAIRALREADQLEALL